MSSHENWLAIWQHAKLPFHSQWVNPYLIKYFNQLELKSGSEILVPLCGKSLDLLWLAQKGIRVTGIELSPIACRDFFIENGLSFEEIKHQRYVVYWNEELNIAIYCADIFDLDNNDLPRFDAIYDRAALVALEPDTRKRYLAHLVKMMKALSYILLISIDSETCPDRPPFPLAKNEAEALFADDFSVTCLMEEPISDDSILIHKRNYSNATVARVYLLKRC